MSFSIQVKEILTKIPDAIESAMLPSSYNINGYDRIYHVHIPKTAGTSLNHMFLALVTHSPGEAYALLGEKRNHRITLNGKTFVGWNLDFINQGRYFYAFSHTPYHKLNLPPRTYTFTCLREPAKRIVSRYQELIEYRNNNSTHPVMKTEGLWLGESFSDFLDRVPDEFLLGQLYSFSADMDINQAYDTIKTLSQYMFSDSFSEGVDIINTRLHLGIEPIHMRQSKKIEIIPGDMERLREKLGKEYRLIEMLRNN